MLCTKCVEGSGRGTTEVTIMFVFEDELDPEGKEKLPTLDSPGWENRSAIKE